MSAQKSDKYTVLIVDDEKTMADVLAQRLTRNSSVIESCVLCDREQVLAFLKEHSIQLVLLDYKMPKMSGIDCLKAIRIEFPKIVLPVIMLTSEESSELIVQCFEEGANDYIVKGSPISVVVSRIISQLSVAALMREGVRLKELRAVMALVISYNHEINNPLSIAIGNLRAFKGKSEEKKFQQMEEALWRIAKVVKSIRAVGDKFEVEYEKYAGESNKMLKLK